MPWYVLGSKDQCMASGAAVAPCCGVLLADRGRCVLWLQMHDLSVLLITGRREILSKALVDLLRCYS